MTDAELAADDGPPQEKSRPREEAAQFHDDSQQRQYGPSQVANQARRELLREFVIEALGVAGHYRDAAVIFARLGDLDCLELSMREFARAGTLAAKTARELVDLRRDGGAS